MTLDNAKRIFAHGVVQCTNSRYLLVLTAGLIVCWPVFDADGGNLNFSISIAWKSTARLSQI